jgi:hypothetical protein
MILLPHVELDVAAASTSRQLHTDAEAASLSKVEVDWGARIAGRP